MKNILYIHGFNSSKDSYTGNTLKSLFPEYNWTLATFDLLKVEETANQIIRILINDNIDTVVSSSLGCIYNLFLKKKRNCDVPMVNKILINPCCIPSKELPLLTDIPYMALEYCQAMEFNIYYRHEGNVPEKLFGIFAKNDEIMHYSPFFISRYGNQQYQNHVMVEGGHSYLSEEVLKNSMLQAIDYFRKMEELHPVVPCVCKTDHLANPDKPFRNPDPNRKPVIYIDMDGTLVDFESGARKLDPITRIKYNGCIDEAPKVFSLMEPVPGAIEAFCKLAKHYDVYILSTAPWHNLTAASDKQEWIQRYFGSSKLSPAYKRLIISHHKELNQGDFLIDDRPYKCGADKFNGVVVPFGPSNKTFPDWQSVLNYFLPEEK